MGWTSSSDMKQQLQLSFDSKDEAVGYAERNGIPYRLAEPKPRQPVRKSYSDTLLRSHRPLDALATGACAPKGHHNRRPVDGHCG